MKAICDYCGREEEALDAVVRRLEADPKLNYRCGACNAKGAHKFFENIKLGDKK
jgi:uncharacterized Zn finger protein